MARNIKIAVILANIFLSGYSQFDEAPTLGVAAYSGCYASGDLIVKPAPHSAIIDDQTFPIKIELRKIGISIVSKFILMEQGGRLTPQASDEHFYRLSNENDHRILIATDQNSYVYNLETNPCTLNS